MLRKEGRFSQLIGKENVITFILFRMKFQMPKKIVGSWYWTAQRANLSIASFFFWVPIWFSIDNHRFFMIDCHFATYQFNIVILGNWDFFLSLPLKADMLDFLCVLDASKPFLTNYRQRTF